MHHGRDRALPEERAGKFQVADQLIKKLLLSGDCRNIEFACVCAGVDGDAESRTFEFSPGVPSDEFADRSAAGNIDFERTGTPSEAGGDNFDRDRIGFDRIFWKIMRRNAVKSLINAEDSIILSRSGILC